MAFEVISNSPDETIEIGRKIGAQLRGGEVLAVCGELGSGKTTFIQGLAQGFEIKEKITSPTFVILKKHQAKNLLED